MDGTQVGQNMARTGLSSKQRKKKEMEVKSKSFLDLILKEKKSNFDVNMEIFFRVNWNHSLTIGIMKWKTLDSKESLNHSGKLQNYNIICILIKNSRIRDSSKI